MVDQHTQDFLLSTMELMTSLFIFLIGLGILTVAIIYILDVSQNKQAIRRNYPVIGHFRYLFEHMGEFFRQFH